MNGKTCLVTGASSGMGKVTALALARAGATVIMLCRYKAKGQAAVEEVKREAGSGTVELLVCDVGSRASIRAAAAEFKMRHQRLHVLVNNAGVNLGKRTLTVDGIEATFATNHLGMF